jgi:Arc/MetJ family transcription regulator
MRATAALDEAMFEKAIALTGLSERNAVLNEALKALVQRESFVRLAALGGSEPAAQYVRRNRQTEP